MLATTKTGNTSARAPRPDLGRRALLLILGWTVTGVAAAILFGVLSPSDLRAPGVPFRQSSAIAATLLLLTPVAFLIAKRSGFTESPPSWFIAHVIASGVGLVLAFLHASGGQLLSPPGILLVLGLFLVIEGIVARAYLSDRFATRFAAQVDSFRQIDPGRRERLTRIIERKRKLLESLDPSATEALFSPNLRHWLRHPGQSFRYARLAQAEAQIVDSRRKAGPVLGTWRRIHMACAALFVAGLLLHVVLVTFFAGYVAGGETVYWWHVSDWGSPQ